MVDVSNVAVPVDRLQPNTNKPLPSLPGQGATRRLMAWPYSLVSPPVIVRCRSRASSVESDTFVLELVATTVTTDSSPTPVDVQRLPGAFLLVLREAERVLAGKTWVARSTSPGRAPPRLISRSRSARPMPHRRRRPGEAADDIAHGTGRGRSGSARPAAGSIQLDNISY
jgi:hypothetical protein